MSRLFNQTLREAPADSEVIGHQLLVRAGFVRPLAAGLFSYLHLGYRSMEKIKGIMRQEMDGIGGQEMTMPVVNPADVWQETERWYKIGDEMGRFVDKNGRDMVLAMSHEEIVTDLSRREIQSYRQLPQLIYHLQTKWRDDPRPRAGLIRAREFTMLDSYSLDADGEGLDAQYEAHFAAYFRIFGRCGLPVIAVEADVGIMGGTMAHEYMYLTAIGEDTMLLCDSCDYRANRQFATFQKVMGDGEAVRPLEKVATPHTKTIEALAHFLNIPKSNTAKAVFMIATIAEGQEKREQFVFAVVRGDMEVNETKLSNAVKAQSLRPATEAEIRTIGAEPGYGSPVGVKGAVVVVDSAAAQSPNLVAGANEEGYHFLNVNPERDYKADVVADITAAQEGDGCPQCGAAMRTVRGVEVANIFKLGTHYSDKMGAMFLAKDGKQRPIIMGSYGIGIGRLLGCIAEEYHDEYGLMWPVAVAPYQVHLVSLRGGEAAAETLYSQLEQAGFEVLFDDREESPGVKFNDADLIGLPLRITVSKRSLESGGAEVKLRHEKERQLVALTELEGLVRGQLESLMKTLVE
jgi:prolyl-tRNA synthetase